MIKKLFVPSMTVFATTLASQTSGKAEESITKEVRHELVILP
jgi:hypothetical protein